MGVRSFLSRAKKTAEVVRTQLRKNSLTGRPRRKLDVVPEPPATPDPFVARKIATEEPRHLGDPQKPAQIFGRRSCPWCGRAVALMQAEGIDYQFIDLNDEEHQPKETDLIRETKQYTVPYVYLRGEFIGGYNALDEIHRLGQLQTMTQDPDSPANNRPSGGMRIVVPKRDPEGTPPA